MDFKKTLSYYEKLGFDKFESWSEEDLAQFLVLDYIETMNEYKYSNMQNLVQGRFLRASQRYKKYIFFKYLIDNIYNKFLRIKLAQENIATPKILFSIFLSDKYLPIISAPKNNYNIEVLVGGMRDRLFAVKNFIVAYSFPNINQFVHDYLIKRDMSYLYALIDNVKEAIKNINPDYIVLWGDGPPVERAIVLLSKKLGITTLEIQHGMYDSFYHLETGKVADYILVWGKYFKDLYVKQNSRKLEDIYVLGYPYLIEKGKMAVPTATPSRILDKFKNLNLSGKNKYVVYYLGVDFETYDKKFLNVKIETVRRINEICNRLGMKFVYRPHPKEDRLLSKEKLSRLSEGNRGSSKKSGPEIYFSPKKEKIEDSIAKGDIFISFVSTSLIEAAMRSKISLQLMNYPIKSDNLEKLGACSKSFQTINELESYLEKIANAPGLDGFKPKFNNDYVETRYNPGERFLEIIREIEKRK